MELNIGGLAATKQTWRKNTVREIVAEIVSANPKATEGQLRREFRNAVRNDEDYFLAVADYSFDAAFRALSVQRERQRPSAEDRAIRAAAAAANAAAHAKTVKGIQEQLLLLNLEMPNGKRMRFCTGEEMTKFGTAYQRIAKKVGKTKMVGQVLGEKEVRALM